MKKELIQTIGKYKVYEVDGKEIRDSSKENEEFTDWATHGKGISQLEDVGKNEVWIDNGLNDKDRQIATDCGLYYLELENNNKKDLSNEKLYDKVLMFEKREIEHAENAGKHPIGEKSDIKVQDGIKVHGPLKIPAGNKVWIVNGDKVREKFKTDFVLGGNSESYKWIPRNEIWIEQDVAANERIYILIHELVEWYLMKVKNLTYDKAHEKASKVEYTWRKHTNQPSLSDLTVNWIRKEISAE